MGNKKGWNNWGDHPIAVSIGALAGIVGIITAAPTIISLFKGLTQKPEPYTWPPVSPISVALEDGTYYTEGSLYGNSYREVASLNGKTCILLADGLDADYSAHVNIAIRAISF